jgi:hypothetical protein
LPSSLSSSSLSSSSSTPTPTSELVPFDSELAVLRSSLPEWSALEEMRQSSCPFSATAPSPPRTSSAPTRGTNHQTQTLWF